MSHPRHEGHSLCEQEESVDERQHEHENGLDYREPSEDDPRITHEPTEKERY